jgi:putative spermidine/putrescine transport system permease protein
MSARTEALPLPPPTPGRRVASWLYARPRLQVLLLLAAPLGALVVIYLGSLAVLLVNAFWTRDPFTRELIREFSLQNFVTLATSGVYRAITLRTLALAALVTVTTAIIGFPIAYYMARVASPRLRGFLLVAILMPLWASYLVKVFAWRTILQQQGLLNWVLEPFGLNGPGYGDVATWLVFTYLWLPYMILPIFAGLERIPASLLEASADLGARAGFTFRRVILPLAFPAVVAGSIFTFSLTLGDYITPTLVSSTQFIGNVVQREVGISGNVPLAAAFATVPILIMVIYLLLARRLGAFEAL